MNKLNNNHIFNLKQREMFARLLAQAKERFQAELESDDSVEERVERELLPKLAQEHGASDLIAKTRKLRKELESVESTLHELGFDCSDDSISLQYNPPKALREALESAKRSALKERNKVVKKFDLATLNVWVSSDAEEAKKIVEGLL